VGKSLLAYRLKTRDAVDEYVAELGSSMLQHTGHTITTSEALHREFEQIRVDGYAIDREEHESGINCLAIPLFLTSRTVPDGAVSVTAVAQRFPLRKLEASVDQARKVIRERLGDVMA
jgi:DNA-binding IclR family transcriptional regulator